MRLTRRNDVWFAFRLLPTLGRYLTVTLCQASVPCCCNTRSIISSSCVLQGSVDDIADLIEFVFELYMLLTTLFLLNAVFGLSFDGKWTEKEFRKRVGMLKGCICTILQGSRNHQKYLVNV